MELCQLRLSYRQKLVGKLCNEHLMKYSACLTLASKSNTTQALKQCKKVFQSYYDCAQNVVQQREAENNFKLT